MDMEDCLAAQSANHFDGIHTLPNQMAGIQVGADFRANSCAKFLQSVSIVNAEALMHLQSNLVHTVSFGKGHEVLPVGNQNFIPLPIQDLQIIIGPSANHPVGIFALRAIAGATREAVDLVNSQLLCHQHGIVHIVVKLLGNLLVGMHRVAVAAQCADLQPGFLNGLDKLLELLLVVKQHTGIAMILTRVTAAADFHHLGTQGFKVGKSLFQRGLPDHIGEYT